MLKKLRAANKKQKKTEKERKAIEKKLKNMDTGKLKMEFPNLSEDVHLDLIGILNGSVVDWAICHTWYDETTGAKTIYSGKIEDVRKQGWRFF